MNRTWTIFSIVTVVGVILDQVTKIWIVNNLEYRIDSIDIIPGFFQLVHAQNPGAAFGIMRNMPATLRVTLFLVFTIVALGVVLDMVRRLRPSDRLTPVFLGMIASGAIGNAIDRIHKQTVTDFLRFYTDNSEWIATLRSYNLPPEYPSFNVADIALVVGVLLYVVTSFLEEDGETEPKPTDGSSGANGAEA